jgi:hypothetical protein
MRRQAREVNRGPLVSACLDQGVLQRSELRLNALQPVHEFRPHRITRRRHPRDDIRVQLIERSLVENEICIRPTDATGTQAEPPHLFAVPKGDKDSLKFAERTRSLVALRQSL